MHDQATPAGGQPAPPDRTDRSDSGDPPYLPPGVDLEDARWVAQQAVIISANWFVDTYGIHLDEELMRDSVQRHLDLARADLLLDILRPPGEPAPPYQPLGDEARAWLARAAQSVKQRAEEGVAAATPPTGRLSATEKAVIAFRRDQGERAERVLAALLAADGQG
jgi:hypothetical protein